MELCAIILWLIVIVRWLISPDKKTCCHQEPKPEVVKVKLPPKTEFKSDAERFGYNLVSKILN